MKKIIPGFAMLLLTHVLNAQSTWIVCNSPTTTKLESVWMPDVNKVIAGGDNGALYMSTDYGATFNPIATGTNEDINALYFFNPVDGIMLLGSNFMKSSDGGATWNNVSNIPGDAKSFYFLNPDTGFVGGDLGAAFSTYDGGITWNILATGVTERLDAVFFRQLGDGFFGGRNNTSLRTFDQGQTFATNVIPANGDVKDIQFVNVNNGFSCGDNGEVLFTGDGGNTWVAQSTPNNNTDMNALHFTDPLYGWCSGEAGVMFHTSDGGITWVSDITNTVNEINNVHLFDSSHGFAVCDNGTIIRLGSGATSIAENQNQQIKFQLSPNPFSGQSVLSFQLEKNETLEITVYDMTGRKFNEIPKQVYNRGTHQVKINPGQIPAGMYECRIKTSGQITSIKMFVRES